MKKEHGKISASMMCCDLAYLRENIRVFEEEGIEYLHIDVMDGEFVPNLGLGIDYVNSLRKMTNILLDIHLMVNRPEEKMKWLEIGAGDRISIHYESTGHVHRAIEQARRCGGKVMLAINPATPVCVIEEVLGYVEGITVLTVNPGFAGQQIVHSCIEKTRKIYSYLNQIGYGHLDIEVDGNISLENAKILRELGANIFVAGTSSIFKGCREVSRQDILRMRNAIA